MFKVLHIDDNQSDIILTRMALEKMQFNVEFDFALNGFEGLEKLRSYKELPGLVMIDVNMPVMGGKEFLRNFKTDKQFDNIPVVVLTTSDYKKDIDDCYDLKVDDYVIKKQDLNGFFNSIKKLVTFWIGTDTIKRKNSPINFSLPTVLAN